MDEGVVTVAIGTVDLLCIHVKGNHRGVVGVIARVINFDQGAIRGIANRAGLGHLGRKGLFGIAGIGLHLPFGAEVDRALVKDEDNVIIARRFINDDAFNYRASCPIAGTGKIELGGVVEAKGFGIIFIGRVGEDIPNEAPVFEVPAVER